jgi:maleate isomerase
MSIPDKLPFETDSGIGTAATLGLIVLETDETIEQEFRHIFPEPDISIYHSRVPMRTSVTPETLAMMEAELPKSARLLPTAAGIDVVGYGCTSGATVIGSDRVATAIQSVLPDVKVTDPIDSIIEACVALRSQSVAFLTPYVPEVSVKMREKLRDAGCNVVAFGTFLEQDDRVVAKITPSSILSAIETVSRDTNCDAVIVSCTNLRVAGIVDEAEKRAGCPVISSNTALAWNMLRLAGVNTNKQGFGSLFNVNSGI